MTKQENSISVGRMQRLGLEALSEGPYFGEGRLPTFRGRHNRRAIPWRLMVSLVDNNWAMVSAITVVSPGGRRRPEWRATITPKGKKAIS